MGGEEFGGEEGRETAVGFFFFLRKQTNEKNLSPFRFRKEVASVLIYPLSAALL